MDRQLLSRATESTEAPTPGYMYLDIAKNAASNPAICQEIATYLTRKLAAKNNANAKFKCLKVITKTATSPYLRGQFKRCISQDSTAVAAVKDALQFRGRPDPMRGDEPYERVRTAAKEALDAIYSDTPPDAANPPFATSMSGVGGGGYGNPPQSHSQSSYGGYGGGGSIGAPGGMGGGGGGLPGSSGRRMEGIGNPMFKDPRHQQGGQQGLGKMTINDVVREAKDTVVGMIKDPLAKNVGAQPGGGHMGSMPRPGGGYGGPGAYPPGRNELAHQTNGQWTMASNRGPDAIAPPSNFNSSRDEAYFKARDGGSNAYAWAQGGAASGAGASGGVGGSWASAGPSVAGQAKSPAYNTGNYGNTYQATPSIAVSGGAAVGGGAVGGGGGTALSDGSYEKNLIMELCPPGGMKPEPPQDKLAQFARSVPSLNADLVCPALLDCLEDGQPWIIRAKALCVMETCLKFGLKPGTGVNPYADFFHACQGEVMPLLSHSRAAIRDPAARVAKLLGLDSASGAAAAAAPLQARGAPPLTAAPAAAPPAAAPAPVVNLLDFDAGPPPAAPSVPPPAAPPAQPAVAPPAAPPAGGSASLFGGLKVSGEAPAAAAPPAPPAVAPAQPAPASDTLLDLMGQAPPAAAPAPTPGTDAAAAAVNQTASMFDNMSVKAPAAAPVATAATSTPATVPAPAAGSAFGFINQAPAPAAPTTSAAAVAPMPAAAAATSFDPLSNDLTPNTAKQMMQISPEQMQAMAYQQAMMQRQMQMMAYQQQMMSAQQHRGSGTLMSGMVMQNPAAARTSLAFMDKQPQRRDDKSFDFVKDAMTSEKKK